MKKALINISITLLSICALVILSYLGLCEYYSKVFPYGTYVNGVYCTGLSVEEANERLKVLPEHEQIVLNLEDECYVIEPEDIDLVADYSESLDNLLSSCSAGKWINSIGNENKELTISPLYSYDEESLVAIVDSWNLGNDEDGEVVLTLSGDDGFVLYDGKESVISKEQIIAKLCESIKNGQLEYNAGDECYIKPEYTDNEKELFELAKKVDAFQNGSYTFNMDGETVKLTRTEVAGLLDINEFGLPCVDDNGDLLIVEDAVYDGLVKVLSPYNSYHNHTFTTHNGKQVYLDKGNYGNEIDIKAECAKLYEAMKNGETNYVSEPEYSKRANNPGPNDIGNTYVEVSLDEQKMFYFEDGRLVLKSDVVTGNKSRGYDTPEGVYAVFYKQRNRTLVGETYRSFVKYWIEFYPHYGLHDASWRKPGAFGGDIYITNGSHGCVNMPTENVAKAYDIVEKGTPVIVYSYSNSKVK